MARRLLRQGTVKGSIRRAVRSGPLLGWTAGVGRAGLLAFVLLAASARGAFGWSGDGGEGVILNPQSANPAPEGDQKNSWFIAGFVGTQWNRFPSGLVPATGAPVHSHEEGTTILSPTGGYYWYDPRKTGHFSFTLELTGAYNALGSSTQIGGRGGAQAERGGFTVLFGTVGYRMDAWEPIIGFGAGAGFFTSESQGQSSSTAVVPVLLVDLGVRYHFDARWSLRFESFFGWTGTVTYTYPSGELVAGHMLSNNVVVGLGYAFGR
ncbi:protein of unknown function [Methylacidimicrobium sp. AP8]|uniref:hypothetical protein n=1 Tax=Methylacidimicrobium sp. AP8 TaxID=2730359 RepID=UPI0018C1069B|nr:hypothetical protein [Methylacidimicrobium sp. AP8]CAB4244237.1 protein of unknown function [Methylacidimicrobium sp. AP8]